METAKPRLYDFKVTSLQPKVPDMFNKYLPKYPSMVVEFNIDNVPASVSNGIRRVIANEILVRGLDCEFENIDTNDEFIIHEMIRKRIRMIPISQNIKPGTELKLYVKNDGNKGATGINTLLDVKTSAFNEPGMNGNHTLLTLNPDKYIKIHAYVVEHMGSDKEYGAFALACNVVSVVREDIVKSSSIADYRMWTIRFIAHGMHRPKDIVNNAINTIIARLFAIELEFTSNNNQHYLQIPGETETINQLLIRGVLELYPECEYITGRITSMGNIELRIIHDNPKKVLGDVIEHLIDTYKKLLIN